MPLYEYECKQCHQHLEKIQHFNAPPLKVCPHCGGKLERVITAPAFKFKGSGWYVTDYAKSGVETPALHSAEDKNGKPADGKAETKNDSTGETKPSSDTAPVATADKSSSAENSSSTASGASSASAPSSNSTTSNP